MNYPYLINILKGMKLTVNKAGQYFKNLRTTDQIEIANYIDENFSREMLLVTDGEDVAEKKSIWDNYIKRTIAPYLMAVSKCKA